MRLRHIEVFHAIMQAGTISGAAQLLHISQPAVTKVLQHCELQLGMPLFDRVRGKLYPTPEAQRLFVEIDKLNRDLVGIRRLAANLKSGESEQVRLIATPALAMAIVPAAMTPWVRAFPNASCSLATHHTREIVSALLLGELALLIAVALPLGMAAGWALVHLLSVLLKTDQFHFPVVILPRTYAWAALCVVAAGTGSALVVRRRIDRLDLVAALKTQE